MANDRFWLLLNSDKITPIANCHPPKRRICKWQSMRKVHICFLGFGRRISCLFSLSMFYSAHAKILGQQFARQIYFLHRFGPYGERWLLFVFSKKKSRKEKFEDDKLIFFLICSSCPFCQCCPHSALFAQFYSFLPSLCWL